MLFNLMFTAARSAKAREAAWFDALHDLVEEYCIAQSAIREFEALLERGIPADKAVDDVFIAHYAVREPYVPDVEPTSARPSWPVLSVGLPSAA